MNGATTRPAVAWVGLRPLLLAAALAAVAGWVDTLGFIGLHGLFTAHVTGNFVLLGTELVGDGGGVLGKLLVLPVFVAGAFAMGVQSAQSRLSLRSAGPTTAMTGNVTQLVLEAMDSMRLRPAERMHARRRMLGILAPVAGFALGCGAGGVAYLAWSFWALLVPIGLLCVLACVDPQEAGCAAAAR